MNNLTLTLIRGLPGSGKSTLAKKVVQEANDGSIHLEADMYFVDSRGVYVFQPAFIKQAHHWCQQQCQIALKNKTSVVVSNTFIKQWEMNVYRDLAKQYHANLIIKTCDGEYQSIHDVPAITIKRMRENWQV